jgi:hypothetical protein
MIPLARPAKVFIFPLLSSGARLPARLRRVLDSYRAGRYWALTAGAFFRAATH